MVQFGFSSTLPFRGIDAANISRILRPNVVPSLYILMVPSWYMLRGVCLLSSPSEASCWIQDQDTKVCSIAQWTLCLSEEELVWWLTVSSAYVREINLEKTRERFWKRADWGHVVPSVVQSTNTARFRAGAWATIEGFRPVRKRSHKLPSLCRPQKAIKQNPTRGVLSLVMSFSVNCRFHDSLTPERYPPHPS